jgi:hypothetical protein
MAEPPFSSVLVVLTTLRITKRRPRSAPETENAYDFRGFRQCAQPITDRATGTRLAERCVSHQRKKRDLGFPREEPQNNCPEHDATYLPRTRNDHPTPSYRGYRGGAVCVVPDRRPQRLIIPRQGGRQNVFMRRWEFWRSVTGVTPGYRGASCMDLARTTICRKDFSRQLSAGRAGTSHNSLSDKEKNLHPVFVVSVLVA